MREYQESDQLNFDKERQKENQSHLVQKDATDHKENYSNLPSISIQDKENKQV